MMSHFAITADEVNKILAQAKFLTRDVDGQRYEAEKWSQLFAKLPRECVKKILEEHECENDEKDLADLAAESVEKSNAIYETLAEYMKTYAGQDVDMLNAAMTKTVRLIKVLESYEAADVKGFFRSMDTSSLTKFLQNKFGFPLRVTTGESSTDAGFLVHDILDMESTAVLSGLRHYFEIQVVEDVSSPVRMDKEVLNDPSDSTNVIVKLHSFDKLPNVEAKGARTWVKNLPQIKNAGFSRKISKVSSIAQGRTLKIHVEDIKCSKVDSILLPALKEFGHVHRLTDEEATTQRKVDAQYRKSKEQQKTQVGNFIGTLGAVSLLAAIHGDDKDGSPKKRRRYARRGQKLLDISQSVAAHGLKEAAGAGEDVSSSEDE